uniref:hypothetical protein n=1 Tax=Pedobacter glucosidilyticus TaxID=1122941 RepID=UPI0026EBB3C2
KSNKSFVKAFVKHYQKASGKSVTKTFNKAQTSPRLPFVAKRFLEDLQQYFYFTLMEHIP